MRCQCANCGAIHSADELNPIKRYWERVDEDDDCEPDGECPDCGALSYAMKGEAPYAIEDLFTIDRRPHA